MTAGMLKKFVFICFFLHLWASLASGNPSSSEFRAKVLGITDCDTLIIRSLRAQNSSKIHLKAIACPRKDQIPYVAQAKQFTQALVQGQVVTVRVYDENGQWQIDVIFDDNRTLTHELVKAGLAWWNVNDSVDEHLATLELMAKSMKRGFWQETNPTPPWAFKDQQAHYREKLAHVN